MWPVVCCRPAVGPLRVVAMIQLAFRAGPAGVGRCAIVVAAGLALVALAGCGGRAGGREEGGGPVSPAAPRVSAAAGCSAAVGALGCHGELAFVARGLDHAGRTAGVVVGQRDGFIDVVEGRDELNWAADGGWRMVPGWRFGRCPPVRAAEVDCAAGEAGAGVFLWFILRLLRRAGEALTVVGAGFPCIRQGRRSHE